MRFRLSPRALALAESVAIQDDKPQGRSTSVCRSTQAAGRYDEVTVERELQEGIRAGAAAPTPKLSQGTSLEMPDETARRLLEDPLLSSRYQRKGTKKSGRRRATSTARLPQLQAQADNKISRGLKISQQFTTSGQSVNKLRKHKGPWLPKTSTKRMNIDNCAREHIFKTPIVAALGSPTSQRTTRQLLLTRKSSHSACTIQPEIASMASFTKYTPCHRYHREVVLRPCYCSNLHCYCARRRPMG